MPSRLFADVASRDAKTPVFVLTGFLGSGKTTLLNRLLRERAFGDTAVIVNELGAVAIDHLLVERIAGEVALLQSGCICCAVRSDFEQTLRDLLARRDEGQVPPFERVDVETTGLADPAPLVHAVDAQPLLAHFCHLGAVLTTVDVIHAAHQLEAQWEARKQVALADHLLLTKTDLAPASAALVETLQRINPGVEPRRLDGSTALQPLLQPRGERADAERALQLMGGRAIGPLHGDVGTLVLRADAPLHWPRLQDWLADLRARDGERLLRLKGIVSVTDEPAPLVLHGVHHLFHPPLAAPRLDWPAARSVLVLILRGMDEASAIEQGFAACVASLDGGRSTG
jgi:G3E family GTPase